MTRSKEDKEAGAVVEVGVKVACAVEAEAVAGIEAEVETEVVKVEPLLLMVVEKGRGGTVEAESVRRVIG